MRTYKKIDDVRTRTCAGDHGIRQRSAEPGPGGRKGDATGADGIRSTGCLPRFGNVSPTVDHERSPAITGHCRCSAASTTSAETPLPLAGQTKTRSAATPRRSWLPSPAASAAHQRLLAINSAKARPWRPSHRRRYRRRLDLGAAPRLCTCTHSAKFLYVRTIFPRGRTQPATLGSRQRRMVGVDAKVAIARDAAMFLQCGRKSDRFSRSRWCELEGPLIGTEHG